MKVFSTLILIVFYSPFFGQNSFVKEINIEEAYLIQLRQNGELSVLGGFHDRYEILTLSKEGKPISRIKIYPDTIGSSVNGHSWYNTNENYHLFSISTGTPEAKSGICVFNFKKKEYWCKAQKNSALRGIIHHQIISSEYLITETDVLPDLLFNPLSLSKISLKGIEQWAFKYNRANQTKGDYLLRSLTGFSSGGIAAGFLSYNNADNETRSGILKLTPTGEVENNLIFDDDTFLFSLWSDFVLDTLGNIYVLGSVKNQSDWNNNNTKEGFIAKLNSNLELVWAKRLSAENFPYAGINIAVQNSGEVLFTYFSTGDLPVITGKLDIDGNLLWNSGYSFFRPQIQIGDDNSIYFRSGKKYFEDGTSENATIIAKTNPDGSIDGCPQFDACLSVFDIDIPLTKWDWERSPGQPLESVPFRIDSMTFTATDHCGTPRPPTSYFQLPDTICQNQSLRPDSIYNHLAHAVQWTITGENTNLEIADTSWNYQFTEPGTYQIEQEIWLLGCSEFFSRTLTVLPDSLGDLLGENRLICEDEPIQIFPTATRPLRTFEWQNRSNNSNITISNSGTYAVTASDGFCSASDAVELTFFNEKYPNEVFRLPTDSSICVDLLPLSLKPSSDYTDEFFINSETEPQAVFELKTRAITASPPKSKAAALSKILN